MSEIKHLLCPSVYKLSIFVSASIHTLFPFPLSVYGLYKTPHFRMAEFLLPVRREEPRQGIRTSRGRVPEVSLHTAVKGHFGLGTGRAMGKALKKAMFLGKLYRKKRALPLPGLPTPKKKLPPDMTYWCPPCPRCTRARTSVV